MGFFMVSFHEAEFYVLFENKQEHVFWGASVCCRGGLGHCSRVLSLGDHHGILLDLKS